MAQICSKRAALTRRAMPAASRLRQFVFAERLEELDVAELTGVSLGQPGLEGVEHARERQASAASSPTGGSSLSRRHITRGGRTGRAGPCRWAGTSGAAGSGSPSFSVPATKMPLTVL